MSDFNKRWDNFAVYLPALQKNYATCAVKEVGRGKNKRALPEDISYKSLDFLNPSNDLWHYKYALYSVGQFNVGELEADMVTNRDTKKTIILGDSGGYQIGKGTLNGLSALKKAKTANDACEIWRNSDKIKKWIVNWLETHSDYAMTIDMPLWAKSEANKKTPFHKCSIQQLIDLSVENLEFIKKNKRNNTKWLNVIQGDNEKDMKLWWDAVKGYKFSGWALAGGTGWRGGSGAVIKQVLMMRDEGAFEKGLDWIHVLGVSQTKWAVILSAIQRGLRKNTNPKIRISFDSASPNQLGGRYESVAVYPKFTRDEGSWSIGIAKSPQAKIYCDSTREFQFPFQSPMGDKLKLHHLNVKNSPMSHNRYDDVSHHLITHHNIWVYVRAMLEANELAVLDKTEAEQFVPKNLLKCLYLIEELFDMGKGKWQTKWKDNQALFKAVDAMSKEEVIVV